MIVDVEKVEALGLQDNDVLVLRSIWGTDVDALNVHELKKAIKDQLGKTVVIVCLDPEATLVRIPVGSQDLADFVALVKDEVLKSLRDA